MVVAEALSLSLDLGAVHKGNFLLTPDLFTQPSSPHRQYTLSHGQTTRESSAVWITVGALDDS